MIKDLFTKKVLAVICAATLSVSSVALAFTTSDYGTGAAEATTAPSGAPTEEPSTEEPSTEEPSTEEPSTEKPTTEKPTSPSEKPTEPSAPPVTLDTYELMGTLPGASWTFGQTLKFAQSADNADVYELTIKNVAAGKYEYKVVKNADWNQSFSTSGWKDVPGNMSLEVKEVTDVTFTLNIKEMTLKTNLDEEPPAEKTDLSAATVTLAKASTTYNGAEQKPVVSSVVLGAATLAAGTDYEVVELESAKNAGTYNVLVNGVGNYKGQACATYKINKKSISNATATVGSKTYNGKKQTSSSYKLTIKLNGKTVTLKKNTDYTVKSASRTSAGSSTVKFTGKGNFTSSKSAKFVVKPKSIKSAKITVPSKVVYTGKSLKPSVTVKDGKTTLKNNKDYTLAYSNNKKIGKATVTVKGKGNYSGSVKKTFKIVPGKTTIKSLKNVKGLKAKVTFKSVKGAKTYNVYYRVKGTSKWKKVTTKKTSVTLSKLKKNKTYQVRISASAKSGKTTYTGDYSKTKTVKIKK